MGAGVCTKAAVTGSARLPAERPFRQRGELMLLTGCRVHGSDREETGEKGDYRFEYGATKEKCDGGEVMLFKMSDDLDDAGRIKDVTAGFLAYKNDKHFFERATTLFGPGEQYLDGNPDRGNTGLGWKINDMTRSKKTEKINNTMNSVESFAVAIVVDISGNKGHRGGKKGKHFFVVDIPCMVLRLYRNLKEGEFVGLEYGPGYWNKSRRKKLEGHHIMRFKGQSERVANVKRKRGCKRSLPPSTVTSDEEDVGDVDYVPGVE